MLAESHKPRAKADADGVEVGLCWHLQKLPGGEPVVWHNGGTGGYATMLAITPATGRAVVVLASVADRRVDEVGMEDAWRRCSRNRDRSRGTWPVTFANLGNLYLSSHPGPSLPPAARADPAGSAAATCRSHFCIRHGGRP